eukprot:gene3690-4208_t
MLWLAFTSTWFVFIIAFAEGESNPLIWRGTKWCGIGSSKSGEETRNITETDLCCKEHDACPLYIPRWQLKYNYFNWRLYTVSSCGCDDKSFTKEQNMQSDSQSVTSLQYFEYGVGVKKVNANKDDFSCVHFIGKGTYGLSTMWIANYKPTKMYVMLRKTNLDILEFDDLENLQYEMQLSSQLLHPSILSFQCSFVHDREIWTMFPLFDYGSCSDILAAGFPNGLNEMAVAYIMKSVLQALDYLHKSGYIHRAVKGSHILVSSDGRVCLTGLRYCIPMWNHDHKIRAVHRFPDHAVAILPWIAPEVLEQNLVGYTEKSDIYSFGITLIELASGKIPFSEMPPTQIFLEKISGELPQPLNYDILKRGKSIEPSSSAPIVDGNDRNGSPNVVKKSASQPPSNLKKLSSSFQQVVDSCLDRQSNQRPSASNIRSCPFFKQVKKKSRESPSLAQLLHPVTPITEHSNFHAEESMDNQNLDASIDIDELSLEDGWLL